MRVLKRYGRVADTRQADRLWRIRLASFLLAVPFVVIAWRFLNMLTGDGAITAMVLCLLAVIVLGALGGKAGPRTIRRSKHPNRR